MGPRLPLGDCSPRRPRSCSLQTRLLCGPLGESAAPGIPFPLWRPLLPWPRGLLWTDALAPGLSRRGRGTPDSPGPGSPQGSAATVPPLIWGLASSFPLRTPLRERARLCYTSASSSVLFCLLVGCTQSHGTQVEVANSLCSACACIQNTCAT